MCVFVKAKLHCLLGCRRPVSSQIRLRVLVLNFGRSACEAPRIFHVSVVKTRKLSGSKIYIYLKCMKLYTNGEGRMPHV